MPLRCAQYTILRGLPCHSPSTSTGTCTESQSCTSCGIIWKCHFSFPVSASSAIAESEYRLSPLRTSPFQSGDGFLVPQMIRLSSGSKAQVTQVGPPPCFHASPDQVSEPFSPGAGIVQKRQRRFPVLVS